MGWAQCTLAGSNDDSPKLQMPTAAELAFVRRADLFAFVQNVSAQAGIEAKNSVTAVAGNDVSITGSTLNAGGDIALQAGRNMTVGWSEKVNPLLGQRQSGVGG